MVMLHAQVTLSLKLSLQWAHSELCLCSQVLCLAPQHTQTRLTLVVLYSVLGMTEDASTVLDEGYRLIWLSHG